MRSRVFYFIFLFCLETITCQSSLLNKLVSNGYENVYMEKNKQLLTLVYENRRHRSQAKVMKDILGYIIEDEPDVMNIQLTPLNRGVPIITVDFNKINDQFQFEGTSVLSRFLSNSPENITYTQTAVSENWRTNSSFGKWVLTFSPDVNIRFHTKKSFANFKLNAIAEGSIDISKGLKFVSQVKVPLLYQYHEDLAEVKPGNNYINYTTRVKDNYWVSSSAGLFYYKSDKFGNTDTEGYPGTPQYLGMQDWYRYGISVEVANNINTSKLTGFLKLDFTGHASYSDLTWYIHPSLDRLTWFGALTYWFDTPVAYIQGGLGKDLEQNISYELKFLRSFNELDLGLIFTWDEGDAFTALSGGAIISLPLPYFNFSGQNYLVTSSKRFRGRFWYHSGSGSAYPNAGNSVYLYQKRLFNNYLHNAKF